MIYDLLQFSALRDAVGDTAMMITGDVALVIGAVAFGVFLGWVTKNAPHP